MDIRKITPLELPLLTLLYDYNDPAEMIEQNTYTTASVLQNLSP